VSAYLYSNSPSRLTYSSLLRGISDAGSPLLLQLIQSLRIPVPKLSAGETLADVAARLEAISDIQFSDWRSATRMHSEFSLSPELEFAIEPLAPSTSEDIVFGYEISPTAALELIGTLAHQRGIQLESRETLERAIQQLIPQIKSDPAPLLSVPRNWNVLLSIADENAVILRDLLLETCRKSLPYRRLPRHSPRFHRFGPMDVLIDIYRLFALYREASGLPYFTDLLLSQLRAYGDSVLYHSARRSAISSELASEFQLSQHLLNEAMNDTHGCWSARCSAAMLLMFLSDGSATPISEVAHLFVENCNSREGEWLLDGLVTTLSVAGRKQTPALTALLRDLFDSCREDYCARASLEQVLMFWREASTAPVTTQGVRDKWLFRSDS
jgi:hypothetical protein